jgi:CDP-paratose synthetase
MSPQTILLTGSTGFIGSHLLKTLLKNHYRVIVLNDPHSSTWRIKEFLSQVKIYNSNLKKLEKVFRENKIDCLIHLATKYVKKDPSYQDIQKMVDVNIRLPTLLSHFCLRYGVKTFINTSTFFQYQIQKKPLTENTPLSPYNLYAATKISCSQILKRQSQAGNLQVINLVLSSIFGPKDNPKLFLFLIKSLYSQNPLPFSGGKQSWNFTYVKDTVHAYIQTLKHLSQLKSYETINIGQPTPYSLKKVVQTLETVSGQKANLDWGSKPYPKDEIFFVTINPHRAEKLIGWKPRYNLKEALKETYDYYLKNPNRL